MTDYIHHTGNVIDRAAGPLPASWGQTSGLHRATTASLKAKGWLPVTYENAEYDPAHQIRSEAAGVQVGDAVPEDADGVTGTYTVTNLTEEALAKVIRAEAERRIDAGIVLQGGLRFRCKTEYLVRIKELAETPAGDFPFNGKTETGQPLQLPDQSAAQSVRVAARDHIKAVLEASADLQDQALAGTFTGNPKTWAGWPSDGS